LLQQTLLGGINMVDYTPFMGDYSNVLVYNNIIQGGFSTDQPELGKKLGSNSNNAIIKCVCTPPANLLTENTSSLGSALQ